MIIDQSSSPVVLFLLCNALRQPGHEAPCALFDPKVPNPYYHQHSRTRSWSHLESAMAWQLNSLGQW